VKNSKGVFLAMTILASLASYNSTAQALDVITGHVTIVEPTYLPGKVDFMMDAGDPTNPAICPAGTWLWWANANNDNNAAVYAMVITAVTTGQKIQFFINAGDTTCTGVYIHLLNTN
jgi:hypothetical protein